MTSPSGEKKERVIHTRVPESLDDEIRRRATELGLSVSNLVRNILQHTVGLVEDIVHDSADIARSARETKAAFHGGAPGTAPNGPNTERPIHVVGWHLAILNVNAVCDSCNAILPKGSRAGVGILAEGGPIPFRCQNCLKELADDEPPHPDS
jgi:hypothetical protein